MSKLRELLEEARLHISMIQTNSRNPDLINKRTTILIGSKYIKSTGGILDQALALLEKPKEPASEFTKELRKQYESIDLSLWVTRGEAELIRNTLNKIPEACKRLDEAEASKERKDVYWIKREEELQSQLKAANIRIKSQNEPAKPTGIGNSLRRISKSITSETDGNIINQAATRLDCWWKYIKQLKEQADLIQCAIPPLEWMIKDNKWRFDEQKRNLEEGSEGGYSPELTEAIDVLKALKDTDVERKENNT